ncbi:MAG: alkaline phosphatase family protein [Candidatus Planktophila sp.]
MHLSQITPSIFSTLGLSDTTDEIQCGPSPAGRELLFLVDGLGADAIAKYASYIPTLSALIRHGEVKTSLPSTTATSLATLTTGVNPGQHGMLGYTVQVPRSGGRILNSLKWDERVDPYIWQPVTTLFERAVAQSINVTHVAAKRYEDTGFTRAVFRGAKYRGANTHADLVSETIVALKDTPAFVYLYVNDLDVAGHSDGVGSDKWLAALAGIDALVATLLQKLPRQTRLWLTADHGMINVGEKIVIGQGNNLAENIATIAGEPRARHLYLSDGASASAIADVASRWEDFLGEKASIYTRDAAVAADLFGNSVSADAADRMGDVIAIAHGDLILIEGEREKQESAMVGHHGGASDIESYVPLLTAVVE